MYAALEDTGTVRAYDVESTVPERPWHACTRCMSGACSRMLGKRGLCGRLMDLMRLRGPVLLSSRSRNWRTSMKTQMQVGRRAALSTVLSTGDGMQWSY